MLKWLISFCLTPVKVVELQGEFYIVMDFANQNVLTSQNEHHIQSVASISKIMTAIVAIENGK